MPALKAALDLMGYDGGLPRAPLGPTPPLGGRAAAPSADRLGVPLLQPARARRRPGDVLTRCPRGATLAARQRADARARRGNDCGVRALSERPSRPWYGSCTAEPRRLT